MLLPVPIVSLRSANTNAFGMDAPRRLSISAFGIATMSAFTVRVHVAIMGAATAGAALFAGAVIVALVAIGVVLAGGAVVMTGAVSVFTESVSGFGDSVV